MSDLERETEKIHSGKTHSECNSIFLQVRQGGVPVQNALVQVSAEYHGPEGPVVLTQQYITVPDDGSGGNYYVSL